MIDNTATRSLPSAPRKAGWSKCKIIRIIAMFMVVSLLLEGLIYLQTEITNGVRAYVRGEGVWAKAQKDAVYYLQRYIMFGNERDYSSFSSVLKIPLGDRQARLALQQRPPDRKAAQQGFLLGQNEAADIDAMVNFFLRFRHVSYMRDAIAIWTEADALIEQLQRLGAELRAARRGGDQRQIRILGERLHELNIGLTRLEYAFSLTLGEGARWVNRITLLSSFVILGLALIVAWLVSSKIIAGIVGIEHNLWVSENRFRSLLQSELLGIVVWQQDGQLLASNQAFLNMIGYSEEDVRAGRLNWRRLTVADSEDGDDEAWKELHERGVCRPREKKFYHRSGAKVPVYVGTTLLDGEQEQGISFILNLSERKRDETRLQLAATVFNASNDGIMVIDSRLRVVTVNDAFCNMSGFPRDELLGHTPAALCSSLMSDEFYIDMWATLDRDHYWQGDIFDYRHDRSIMPLHMSISAVYEGTAGLTHYVAIFTDISERKQAEKLLQRLAHYDYLTGLANRNLLPDRLDKAIQRAERNHTLFAVLFLDLDGFKSVNDDHGHEAGDRLLQEVAARLQTTLRGNDSITRFGGDEFVVLLEDLHGRGAAAEIAERLIETVGAPMLLDGQHLHVGCSIGISFYPDDSRELHELVRSADRAMYAAKSAGRNRYQYAGNAADTFRRDG